MISISFTWPLSAFFSGTERECGFCAAEDAARNTGPWPHIVMEGRERKDGLSGLVTCQGDSATSKQSYLHGRLLPDAPGTRA